VQPQWSRRGEGAKRRKLFPVNDVRSFPLAALLGVGAKRHQVVIAMLAGETVDVRMTPGVQRYVLPQIRTIPIFEVAGTRPEGLQPFFIRWVAADIQLERIENGLKFSDLGFGCNLARLLHVSEQSLADKSRKQGDDNHDNQQFDKSDTSISSFRVH